MPKLLKIIRDRKFIEYRITRKGHQAEESVDVTCREAPMASFDKALQELAPTAARILELPKDWSDTLVVLSVSFSFTKSGTGSAVITFDKSLSNPEVEHRMSTPSFRFEKPASGEDGRMECTPGDAEKIERVIKETEKYIAGQRQQLILPMEDPKQPTEPAGGDELPGIGGKTTGKKK
jgi:hypothetical protein